MNRLLSRVGAYALTSAFCLITVGRLSAQTTAAPAATKPADEETIVLSPFVVDASEDAGAYTAKSSLAGTRVRTDLKDISSSISVVTKAFLQDTGAHNNQDLLVYTPSTEVGGLRGNFSGQAGNSTYNEALTNPSNNTRVRGLDAADNTRDYFITDIPWDSFNVGRVDLQRGPNSILFGVGSPAGIINNSVNDAMFKRSYSFENVTSQYGGIRNSLDVNHVLIDNVLSVRIAAVNDQARYQQEEAYNKTTRYYAAMRYEPKLFGEGNNTLFRAKYENGQVRSNNPRTIPPVDEINPWFGRLRKLTLNQYVPGNDSNGVGSDPFNARGAVGGWKQGRSYWAAPLTYYSGGSPVKVITSRFATGWRINSAGVVDRGGLENGIGGNPNFNPVGIANFGLWAANSGIPGGSYYADQTLRDPTIFDFYNHILDGNNKREWQGWNAYNIALSQSFFNNTLSFEAVYDRQSYSNGYRQFLNSVNHAISIDVNQTYADGTANPNVGRPYVANAGAGSNGKSITDRESKRYTASYDFDAKDHLSGRLGKYLGRHVFTGLWAQDERRQQDIGWNAYAASEDWAVLGNQNISPVGNYRQFDWVYYLGPSLSAATTAHGANLPGITSIIQPGKSSPVTYYDSHWIRSSNPSDPNYVDPNAPYTYTSYSTGLGVTSNQAVNPANYAGWKTGTVTWLDADNPQDLADLTTSGTKRRFKDTSKALTWQGYLLDGDLVGTYGWRKDKITNYSTPAPQFVAKGTVATDYNDDQATLRTAEGQSRSWGIVLHVPKKITSHLPYGTGLSLFYNKSGNYKAEAPRQNLFGQTIGNPDGKTREYGITITTLEDKLSLKIAKYKTEVANATLQTGANGILGGNGYWMWAAPTWGMGYASFVEATLDGVAGAQNGNYLASDGTANNGAGDPVFENAPQTALSRQIVAAWKTIPLPSNYYEFWGINRGGIRLPIGSKIRDSFVGWTPGMDIGGFQPGGNQPVTTVDTLSEGTEYELSAQPIKNWNLAVNYTDSFASKSQVDPATALFMTNLKAFFDGPGGSLRMWGAGGSPIRNEWIPNVYNPYLVVTRAAGQATPEVAKWRLNGVTTYSFDRGRLKGSFIGGGIRWEAPRILGYTYDATILTLDINHPLMGKADQHYDLWMGYKRKLKGDINWRIQLNLRDVGEKSHLVSSRLNPDGSIALARIQQGMTWQLTNAFDF